MCVAVSPQLTPKRPPAVGQLEEEQGYFCTLCFPQRASLEPQLPRSQEGKEARWQQDATADIFTSTRQAIAHLEVLWCRSVHSATGTALGSFPWQQQ